MDLLKLVALDGDDMEVVSAHLQDAVVKVADIRWRPTENRLVVCVNRFDWEAAQGTAQPAANGTNPEFRRRRAVLRFDRVSACKCRDLSAVQKDQVLNLLAVSYAPKGADDPAGVVTLTFWLTRPSTTCGAPSPTSSGSGAASPARMSAR